MHLRLFKFAVATAALLFVSTTFAQPQTGGTVRVARSSGSYTNNSNPFGTAGQNLPSTALVYEPLFFVNTVTGELTPILGTSYKWSQDNLTLTIKTREGVQWSDGEPFSAQDVAFTFDYMKEHPELDTTGVWSLGVQKRRSGRRHYGCFHLLERQYAAPKRYWPTAPSRLNISGRVSLTRFKRRTRTLSAPGLFCSTRLRRS